MKHLRTRGVVSKGISLFLSGVLAWSMLAVPATALAEPSNLDQELSAATTHLSELADALAQAEAELGKTNYELDQTKAAIAELQVQIEQNTINLAEAREKLAAVIGELYRQGGEMGLLDLILNSESFEQLLQRLYVANKISEQKRQAVEEVSSLQNYLEETKALLEGRRQEQESLLAAQKDQVNSMQYAAMSQADYVGSLSAEVVQAMEAERLEETARSLQTAAAVLSQNMAAMEAAASAENAAAAQGDQQVTDEGAPVANADDAVALAQSAANTVAQTAATVEQASVPSVPTTPTQTYEAEEPVQTSASTASSSYSGSTSSSSYTSSGSSGYSSSAALAAVSAALEQVGKSYGHENDGSSWDCNGLTNYAWSQAGLDIPYASGHYAYGQYQYMQGSDNWVSNEDDLQAGDLVFYSHDGGDTTYHVAMYIGDGQIVHAVDYSEGVQVTDLDYVSGFVGGGSPY